jgi:hypothetical protein
MHCVCLLEDGLGRTSCKPRPWSDVAVRFKALTVGAMKVAVFRDMAMHSFYT